MIDTHCHIDFKPFNKDREEVLKRTKEELTAIVNSGTSYKGNQGVLKLAKENSNFLYPSFGFHPVSSGQSSKNDIKIAMDHMVKHLDDIVGIGEVGMDYFHVKDKKEREKQGKIFESFAELANEHEVPLIIHGRDCEKKAYNIIKKFNSIPEVIFHCYSGSLKTANKLVDEGYYLSFSTMISYSKHHQELAKDIPLENILTETDSPYLAPKRGERNEPRNVAKVIEILAKINEEKVDVIDKITEKNAKKVFNIK